LSQLTFDTCNNENLGYEWLLIPQLQENDNTSLQQIGWVGNVQVFPPNLNTNNALLLFIQQNNIMTMDITGIIANLTPWTSENNISKSAQYIDYNLYNIIINNDTPFSQVK
jgi:hypothetical protein